MSLNINKENKLPRAEECVFGNVIIMGGGGLCMLVAGLLGFPI